MGNANCNTCCSTEQGEFKLNEVSLDDRNQRKNQGSFGGGTHVRVGARFKLLLYHYFHPFFIEQNFPSAILIASMSKLQIYCFI